jgi:ribosomal protein L16 Arg81 hydroxylase
MSTSEERPRTEDHSLGPVAMTKLSASLNEHRITGTQMTQWVKRCVTCKRVSVFSAPDTLRGGY